MFTNQNIAIVIVFLRFLSLSLSLYIYIYIYTYIYVKMFIIFCCSVEKNQYFKMNRSTKRFISFKNYLLSSYVCFQLVAFFRQPFNNNDDNTELLGITFQLTIYICVCVCVCVCVCISKWIGPQKDLYLLINHLFNSWVNFRLVAFLRQP